MDQPPAIDRAETRLPILCRTTDVVFCAAFFVFWLTPIFYVGLTNSWFPIAPRYLNDLYRVANLFPNRIDYWWDFYIQVQTTASSTGEWVNVADEEFTTMYPFGYRSRFNILLSHAKKTAHDTDVYLVWKDRLHDEIALFIKQRYEQNHPDGPKVTAVRIGEAHYPVGGEIAAPPGRWQKPFLVQVLLENRQGYFERTFSEESAGGRASQTP